MFKSYYFKCYQWSKLTKDTSLSLSKKMNLKACATIVVTVYQMRPEICKIQRKSTLACMRQSKLRGTRCLSNEVCINDAGVVTVLIPET